MCRYHILEINVRSKLLILALALTNLLLFNGPAVCQANETGYHTACLGNFCFEPDLPKLKVLIKQYGNGSKVSQEDDIYYCYMAKEEKAFVKFFVVSELPEKISGVLVSKVPNCSSSHSPKTPFDRLLISKGIAIGDPVEKILRVYGNPSFIRERTAMQPWLDIDFATASQKPIFDSMFLYGYSDLLQVIFYVKDKHISAMKLSVTE